MEEIPVGIHLEVEQHEYVVSLFRCFERIQYPSRRTSAWLIFLSKTKEQYEDFSEVTRKSLHHALAEHGVDLDDAEMDKLMQAYDSLSTFPDVNPALKRLQTSSEIECVVFSNGTGSMVSNSVYKSGDLDSSAFKDIVTVDHVRAFKPAPEVYKHLAEKTGNVGREHAMWLVSGNPFDVTGARSVGMQAAWVDRAGNGWQDRLGLGPTVVVRGLGEVAEAVEKHAAREQ